MHLPNGERRLPQRVDLTEGAAHQVIAAVQLDGMKYQELSELTGIPVATLRARMYYGLKSLRVALTGDPEVGDGLRSGGSCRR
ncbi:sigma factor-like helix-turn-helix DNA-binding protein [Nesterenkonia aurantiaca]|uniref:sigma factor-like helix-turn-helix DNA-binding protein n=1 Tax=Nesterenkonia aurantiaca TaxID=1436010 RepID=UPI003C7DA141